MGKESICGFLPDLSVSRILQHNVDKIPNMLLCPLQLFFGGKAKDGHAERTIVGVDILDIRPWFTFRKGPEGEQGSCSGLL